MAIVAGGVNEVSDSIVVAVAELGSEDSAMPTTCWDCWSSVLLSEDACWSWTGTHLRRVVVGEGMPVGFLSVVVRK